jgi:hypothetical protein
MMVEGRLVSLKDMNAKRIVGDILAFSVKAGRGNSQGQKKTNARKTHAEELLYLPKSLVMTDQLCFHFLAELPSRHNELSAQPLTRVLEGNRQAPREPAPQTAARR